ncbi:unnamed protein product [Cylicocyclus nassatus]|uniref:Uncharacterized protein n=1 Tax=Cylicocyclus nassatus TaxID=53992 RepID=A0AA36MBB3_CYLNA|nr:unnamed protein product [Cylicocyclus nassatus]
METVKRQATRHARSTAIMIDSGESYVITTVLVYFSIVYLVVSCKGKKKEMQQSSAGSSDSGGSLKKPRAPEQKGMAGTFDPNYQTLANVQDPFAAPGGIPGAPGVPGAAPPQPPKPPAGGGMAGTFDPNYQTLANIQGDVFGADKAAGVGAAAAGKGDVPAPAAPLQIKPGTGGVAGTYDPNYQTLAGMNADVFGKDKKAA